MLSSMAQDIAGTVSAIIGYGVLVTDIWPVEREAA